MFASTENAAATVAETVWAFASSDDSASPSSSAWKVAVIIWGGCKCPWTTYRLEGIRPYTVRNGISY